MVREEDRDTAKKIYIKIKKVYRNGRAQLVSSEVLNTVLVDKMRD